MTAREWLESRFPLCEDENGKFFVAVTVGDFEHYAPNDPDRVTSQITNADDFLAWFGATIQTALDTGKNPVVALNALPNEEKRGFRAVFQIWQAKGLS